MGQAFTFVLEMLSVWCGWELLLEVRRTFLVAGMERVFAAPQEESFTTIWGSRSNHPSYGWLRVWCVGGVGGSDALILMSVILNRISWNCASQVSDFPMKDSCPGPGVDQTPGFVFITKIYCQPSMQCTSG
jgi:hypothetical protein